MNEFILKIKNCGFIKDLKYFLSSKYFPFITAAVTLLCYYLGWDIVLIYYISIVGILILLLLDDITPVISLILFMSIAVSYQNSPSTIMENSDYFSRTEIFVQTVILLTLFAAAAIYRITALFVKKQFKLTNVFIGLCVFAGALVLNGIFSENYTPKNIGYGLSLAACFLLVFTGIKDNINADENTFEKISLAFIALSAVLLVELTVKYITVDNLIVNGEILRGKLTFGWGMWNTMGMMLVLCLPFPLYLAGKKKYGFVYTLYSVLLFVACFMSCSRQAMIAVCIVYPVGILVLLIKGKNRWANLCIFGAAAVAGIVLISVYWDTVIKYFLELMKGLFVNGQPSGNGRMALWKQALSYFASSQIFGVGFYVDFTNDPGFSGMSFIPLMCHNTILQLLSACGIVGFIAYVVHRVQTVISFFNNVTFERIFITLAIAGLLITSLFDNHIFYIFPTLIYSALLAVFVKSEKKQ